VRDHYWCLVVITTVERNFFIFVSHYFHLSYRELIHRQAVKRTSSWNLVAKYTQ